VRSCLRMRTYACVCGVSASAGLCGRACCLQGMIWNDTKKPPTYIQSVIDRCQHEYLDGVYEMHAADRDHIAWAKVRLRAFRPLWETLWETLRCTSRLLLGTLHIAAVVRDVASGMSWDGQPSQHLFARDV
jgi:hypothetical protein